MENLVYHYCSNETFKKILSNPRFKLTDITKSNDRYEVAYFWNSYIRYIQDTTENKYASALSAYLYSEQMSHTTYLATCFSEEKDSLLMWALYARCGVAIGFDKKYLTHLSEQITIINNNVAISQNATGNLIGQFGAVQYLSEKEVYGKINEGCKNTECLLDAFDKVFHESPFHKTRFWEMEKEWRLVVKFIENDQSVDISEYKQQGIVVPNTVDMEFENIESGQTRLCCYIPFDKSAIKSIVIAPNNTTEEKEIRFLLRKNGFAENALDITRSAGSLR